MAINEVIIGSKYRLSTVEELKRITEDSYVGECYITNKMKEQFLGEVITVVVRSGKYYVIEEDNGRYVWPIELLNPIFNLEDIYNGY